MSLNVIVVGANRGIGLEITRQLMASGNKVHALCRKSNEELTRTGANIIEDVEVTNLEKLAIAKEKLEGEKIDWFLHVSGILIGDRFKSFKFEDLSKQFEVNTLGPLKALQTFLPLLGTGSKVGILSSKMGSLADNTSGGQYGYRLSKSAINSIAVSLAHDLKGDGIAVNILHPGYVRTDMTGGNGLIDSDESAEKLIKIMNEKGLTETGRFWHVNGDEIPW